EEVQDLQRGLIKGNWKFPPNAVLAKTLFLEMEAGNAASKRRLETQILHFDHDTWKAYTYRWNEEQTDAALVPAEGAQLSLTVKDPRAPGGKLVQPWRFVSRTECILCHTTRAGSILGFLPEQLHREPQTAKASPLQTFNSLGIFAQPLPEKLPH